MNTWLKSIGIAFAAICGFALFVSAVYVIVLAVISLGTTTLCVLGVLFFFALLVLTIHETMFKHD